ncbi:MAG: glycosyltransferase family 4 protein [Pseudomonadota bacterium]|uniref:glycosyltransferase family 4 protein n=1 Tax=Fodinicurvata fenggangensis TaxID=1121830 RepID=UPI0009DE1046|nr:glycosyltransferase family 4 protein [Fodinicurvata fenggangensis]
MPAVCFMIPGDPETRTGGYHYDRQIMKGFEERGLSVELARLSEDFPFPGSDALVQVEEIISRLPSDRPVVVDGLAFGAFPEHLAARLTQGRQLIALVHHPLARETGLTREQREELYLSERRSLAFADRVVVTGPATARELHSDYQVPKMRLQVILPGTEHQDLATGGEEGCCNLLTVATLTPRKNQLQLLEALAELKLTGNWKLTLAGSDQRDRAYAAEVAQAVLGLGLQDRVIVTGELSPAELDRCYYDADVFVLPSLLEGYGMVFAEALARGLPIVAPRSAGIVETLPDNCGLFVEPGDLTDLRQALDRVLNDADCLATLQARALEARKSLPRWEDAVDGFARLLAPDRIVAGK